MNFIAEAYDRLFATYGPQHWWPANSPFEVMVGAVLVQNTDWRHVEKSIAKIKAAKLLTPRKLYATSQTELQQLILPAGPHRVKEKRLRNLLRLIVEDFGGSLKRLFALPTDELRETLLAVNGVGPETADDILLYAADRPRFVIDAYTRRIFERHGWLAGGESYAAVQELFESHLPADTQLFNEYHALLVQVAKQHCRPVAQCEGCPLQPMLPDSE